MVLAFIGISLIALFLLWLFLAAPALRRSEGKAVASVSYAHRGLHGAEGAPENSLAAFRRAIEAGCGIELDVQLSSDGVPIVFHDESLLRVCGDARRATDLTAAQLAAMRLADTEEHIPTLSEVLALVGGSVPLLVELKYYRDPVGLARETAALLDGYGGAVAVQSFHPLALRWFRLHRPRTARGLLAMSFLKRRSGCRRPCDLPFHLFLTNFLSRPDFISYDIRDAGCAPLRLLRLIYRPAVIGWTARSEAERRAAGFDAFIFEQAADCREGERF